MKQLAVSIAVLAIAAVTSANILVPNGDFEISNHGTDLSGTDWVADGPARAAIWQTGGNGGGCATLDSSPGWGWGVFVSNGGDPLPLSYFGLGLGAGDTITIEMDMKEFINPTGTGGLKMESWTSGAIISDSGDMNRVATTGWTTFSFDYTIAAGATHLKFVPLSVSGDVIGFDNIGVVPEPATLGLAGLAGGVILFLRRRFRI